ncbi:hypothetical protein J6590_000860 [Homalodisca vitripennis]|nr:hypothetical protein J6590_000860 [Homalodisca vitripennis]
MKVCADPLPPCPVSVSVCSVCGVWCGLTTRDTLSTRRFLCAIRQHLIPLRARCGMRQGPGLVPVLFNLSVDQAWLLVLVHAA